MTRYLARHILRFVLLMAAVGLVVFALVSASPIDPVQANVGQAAYVGMSEAKRAQLASYWGGDVPFWERFANWAGALLQGDMGTSLRFNAPVSEVIARRAANSLALMGIAWLVSGVLGFVLGVVAGARRGGAVDRMVCGYCFLLASTPTFWLGLLILMIFAVQLGWFPLAVFPAAVAGALMAFLLWNFPPAKLRPGKCGCLFLAGAIGCVPLSFGSPGLAVPLALPFWMEGGMVVLQMVHFRRTGRPLFAAAPLHRWLEKRGADAVTVFCWLCAFAVCGLALALGFVRMS